MTSNCAKPYISWIREARWLPIVQMVDYINVHIMNQMNTRRQMTEKWHTVLCPEPQKFLDKNMSESFNHSNSR